MTNWLADLFDIKFQFHLATIAKRNLRITVFQPILTLDIFRILNTSGDNRQKNILQVAILDSKVIQRQSPEEYLASCNTRFQSNPATVADLNFITIVLFYFT